MKSTAYSVAENLPFCFLPDTIPPVRNSATRQRRGESCNRFQIASWEKSLAFFLFLNPPVNGREEKTHLHINHILMHRALSWKIWWFLHYTPVHVTVCHLRLWKGQERALRSARRAAAAAARHTNPTASWVTNSSGPLLPAQPAAPGTPGHPLASGRALPSLAWHVEQQAYD